MNFIEKYRAMARKNDSYLCIGLDPDVKKIPGFLEKEELLYTFCKEIVDATHDLVCAYKPNSAFFEALGDVGIKQLYTLTWYIKTRYPEIPIILDAKRADIGNTNEGYAAFAFDYLGTDAITISPYLGKEAVMPFLSRKDKGCIVLCKTSNPGAGEFQDLPVGDHALYRTVASHVAHGWNDHNNCMLVVGATYPNELSDVRKVIGDVPILIPGVGAQGGDLEKTVTAGRGTEYPAILINASRSVLYATGGNDWKVAAREEAIRLRDGINACLRT